VLPFAAALLALAGFASAARADEKNPAVEACVGKTEGNPCTHARVMQDDEGRAAPQGEPGVCRPDECCTLDYSQGSPPKSVCNPCLACQAGAPSTPGADDAATARAGGEPPRAGESGPPPHDPQAKKGCAIDEAPLGGASSMLLVLALVGRARRRTQS
jgi:hypothetical protein